MTKLFNGRAPRRRQFWETLEKRVLLAITNGFETPALLDGGSAALTTFGWANVSGYGEGVPIAWRAASTVTDFAVVGPLASPADGSQLAAIPDSGGAFERFFGTVAANTIYTATIAVGDAKSEAYGDWSIELWAGAGRGTTLLARLSRDSSGAVHPADGAWADNSLTFNSGTNSSFVGQNLFVRFTNYAGSHPGAVYLDNLRLSTAAASDVTLNATNSLVEIANRSQKVTFAKNGLGRFKLASFTRDSGGSWVSLFDAQSPIVQGSHFDLEPTSYQVIENSPSRIAVQFSGNHVLPTYAWTMLVETTTGSDLVHFTVTAQLPTATTISGLEPQAALWMNRASPTVAVSQGPGNIYYGYETTQWGNSFPAAYLWSQQQEAAIFFNMTPTTWMSASNLHRFFNVRTAAFTQSGKTGLGLQVIARNGDTIPAGAMTYDFYLYAKAAPTQPSKVQALNKMVQAFGSLHPATANWPTNLLDPTRTDWTRFAEGTDANLQLKGIVYDTINLNATTLPQSFETLFLAPGDTLPLTNYGWTQLSGYGSAVPSVWRPKATATDFNSVDPLAAPGDGSQVVFISEPGGGTERQFGTIQSNSVYTATVAVGNRIAEGEGDWSIQLWAGNGSGTTFLGQMFRDLGGASHPPVGGWTNNSVSFNSAANPSVVGQKLYVRLTNYAGTHPGTVFFDNVRVSGVPNTPGAPWRDTPLFPENSVSVLPVSSAYAVKSATIGSGIQYVQEGWDFSTVNNYLAPWIAYDQLNPDTARHQLVKDKAWALPLFYDPNAGMIRWGTRYPLHIGDLEMSWQNFTFALETIKSYRMLAPEDFNPAIAGKFLMGLDGLMTLAHNVNYVFPQWFNPYTKVALIQQDVPELGVIYEPWQGGTYAYLMLEGYRLTGSSTYLNEAQTAVNMLLGGGMSFTVSNSRYNITYNNPADFPITEIFGNAWGIAACRQLYTITGNATYQQYSDYFFDSLMRMSYWYESSLAGNGQDLALQNVGMFRNHGGAFTGSPWENIEAMLPMTVRLKEDATPRDLMLRLFNTQRINGMYFYPPTWPPAAQPGPQLMESAADYLPVENFYMYESGGSNGSMGRCTYMASMALWNYLLYEAFASSSDRDVMVLNLDAVDAYQRAKASVERSFIVHNPMGAQKSITLTMKALAAGRYNLIIENFANGATTALPYTSDQLLAGVPLTIKGGGTMRIRLQNLSMATLGAQVQSGQDARDHISYAYALLQKSAVSGGITPALLQLKTLYQSALSSYGTGNYATADAIAEQVISAILNPSSPESVLVPPSKRAVSDGRARAFIERFTRTVKSKKGDVLDETADDSGFLL